jgi:hypothetical protein
MENIVKTSTVHTVDEILSFYDKKWDTKRVISFTSDDLNGSKDLLPCLVKESENLSNEVINKVFGMTYQIAKDTFTYIERLKTKVYVCKVENQKFTDFILFSPKGSPKEYFPYLKDLDTKLSWNNHQKQEIKTKPWKFMACVLQYNNEDADPSTHPYYNLLQSLFKKSKFLEQVHDGLYVFSLRDTLLIRKDGMDPWIDITGVPEKLGFIPKKFLPIFNSTGGKDYYDIPIPTFEDISYAKNPSDFSSIELSWNKKKDTAIFRGSVTGCGYTFQNNPRLALAKLSLKLQTSKNPFERTLLDAKLTRGSSKKYRFHRDTGLGYFDPVKNNIFPDVSNSLTKVQQSHYKYIIEVEGNVAAHRIATDMLLGSVLIMVESEYTLWFTHLLIPNVHYIPVKKDLSNLVEQVLWCRENDEICSQIAKNGRNFALEILQMDLIENVIGNGMLKF